MMQFCDVMHQAAPDAVCIGLQRQAGDGRLPPGKAGEPQVLLFTLLKRFPLAMFPQEELDQSPHRPRARRRQAQCATNTPAADAR